MKSTEFCYWLQGLFELSDVKNLDEKQTSLIKKHLDLVFFHEIDKSYPEEQQLILNHIHSGTQLELTAGIPESKKIPPKFIKGGAVGYNNTNKDGYPNDHLLRC